MLSSMTAYGLLADQLRKDARSLDHSIRSFRRTIEYGLPLFIRDEEFLQVTNALECTSRRQRREQSLWRKLKVAGKSNWNAGIVGAVEAFHTWSASSDEDIVS
ncbi:hypothetical protein BGW38_010730 [Lunasporangiospora selenospora]|uniref:Uncharacterized protein n=1 Tax=Lunasporangiospora selenospora TaxID=979761 RepID=A0A9P6FWC0_9FUNG|nr:hypothetical protein BGW38_010730 [Lunasporangiospora selenospora]